MESFDGNIGLNNDAFLDFGKDFQREFLQIDL
jgi:hypothetical protein